MKANGQSPFCYSKFPPTSNPQTLRAQDKFHLLGEGDNHLQQTFSEDHVVGFSKTNRPLVGWVPTPGSGEARTERTQRRNTQGDGGSYWRWHSPQGRGV